MRRFETPSNAKTQKYWEIHRMNRGRDIYRKWGLSDGSGLRVKLDTFDSVSEADTIEGYLIAKRRRNGYLEVVQR